MFRLPIACLSALLLSSCGLGSSEQRWTNDQSSMVSPSGSGFTRPPNILIILTDDQDDHMETITREHMPMLNKYILDKGAYHPRHYCTIALCCPSRTSLWTGLQGHNHNVTDVGGPYGGYAQVVREGHNDNYLFLWMQAAGYDTYYGGKLWNGQSLVNYNNPPARGFNVSRQFVGPNVYDYFNVSYTDNFGPVHYSNGNHSTVLLTDTITKPGGWLDQAFSGSRPWLMVAAPTTPHVETKNAQHQFAIPPTPEVKYQEAFPGFIIPRTPDFNPDTPGGAAYYRAIPKLNQTVIDYNDDFARKRLQALLSVDDMIKAVVEKIEGSDQADNTYIVFTSDNGFHISQHRLLGGKECGLETDVRIPFAVRGPGIGANTTNLAITNHVDMSPTLLALAGQAARPELDGGAMPWNAYLNSRNETVDGHEHSTVEFWGTNLDNGIGGYSTETYGLKGYPNNTFTSVRLIGDDYSFYYSVWCSNEHEVYDMTADPYQLNNLYYDPKGMDEFTFQERDFNQTMARLDTLLLTIKACKGQQCRTPWATLMPDTGVSTLARAMDSQWDDFFASQPKVSFSKCSVGHIIDLEGPQQPDPLGKGSHSNEDMWFNEDGSFNYERGYLVES